MRLTRLEAQWRVLRTQVSRDGKLLTQSTTLPGASSSATGGSASDTQIFTRSK